MEPPALRTAVLANEQSLERTVGTRPTGLAGRDAWMRAASAAVRHDLISPEMPDPGLDVADIGLDL